jgi:uncharacterized coiled-coil protein SlyX
MAEEGQRNKKVLMLAGGAGLLLAVLYVASRSPKTDSGSGDGAGVSAANTVYTTLSEAITNAIDTLREEFETRFGTIEAKQTAQAKELEEQAAAVTALETLGESRYNQLLSQLSAAWGKTQSQIVTLNKQEGDVFRYTQAQIQYLVAASTYPSMTKVQKLSIIDQIASVFKLTPEEKGRLISQVTAVNPSGGVGDYSFLAPVIGGPVGWLPSVDFSPSRPLTSGKRLDQQPVKVQYGMRH